LGVFLSVCLFQMPARPGTFTEDFSTPPSANGWQTVGHASLFDWDSTNQILRVTWDSAQTNSYFHRPLGTILTSDDDFRLSFDLRLDDCAVGTTPGKSNSFEIAIGLLNLDEATRTNFFRGAGVNSSSGPNNLVEFNFFPAWNEYLPTIAQAIVSTNHQWLFNHENLFDLTPGETYHVTMHYLTATRTLTTGLSNNGVQVGVTQTIPVPPGFDFRLTSLAISSYQDGGQIPAFAGSILAHGAVDNFVLTVPDPPVTDLQGAFADANWEVRFISRTNWFYTLERTTNFSAWTHVSAATPGTGGALTLLDVNWPAGSAAYRVKAQRP
jgi:hypothetical protein